MLPCNTSGESASSAMEMSSAKEQRTQYQYEVVNHLEKEEKLAVCEKPHG